MENYPRGEGRGRDWRLQFLVGSGDLRQKNKLLSLKHKTSPKKQSSTWSSKKHADAVAASRHEYRKAEREEESPAVCMC